MLIALIPMQIPKGKPSYLGPSPPGLKILANSLPKDDDIRLPVDEAVIGRACSVAAGDKPGGRAKQAEMIEVQSL